MSIKYLDTSFGNGLEGAHFLNQHLSSNGDGTGTINVNGIYTAGDGDGVFYITPPANTVYYITDFHIHIEDTALRADYYDAAAALANGMLCQVRRAGATTYDLTGGEPVTKTAMWAHFIHNIEYHNTGAGNAFMSGHHSFLDSQGRALVLDGDQGDLLRVVAQDTLTGLVAHQFMVQGLKAPKSTRTAS